jgi:protein-tyrosine phosphatase
MGKNGIRRVVKLFADAPGDFRFPGVEYLVLPAVDAEDYDIRDDAVRAVRFIQDAVSKNERVLVHCRAGVSRSATVVLFYLILSEAYTLPSALLRLRRARPVVRPNAGFLRHLAATDERLRQLRIGDERRYVAPLPMLGGEACEGRRHG